MLTRRIIPCLDVQNGRVVKGVGFRNLVDAGDPVERAEQYMKTGADELCFLDVAATVEDRSLSASLVERISDQLAIPFTVGGGIRSVENARSILRAGADKVAVNTAAFDRPALLTELAESFGRQCVVVSIDTVRTASGWMTTTHGGKRCSDRTCMDWCTEAASLGAGEILLNVIDGDGTRNGFYVDITKAVTDAVSVPVIASGGGGRPDHFVEVFARTRASAALAASIFHDDSWTPDSLKAVLKDNQIEVRL